MSGLLNNSSLKTDLLQVFKTTLDDHFLHLFQLNPVHRLLVFIKVDLFRGSTTYMVISMSRLTGTLGSRNPTTAIVPSSGLQQQSGNLSAGRFTSNNMPAALSQLAHGNSFSHSGLNSRGSLSVVGTPGFSSGANAFSGSIPLVLPTTAPISNCNSIPGVGVPPVLGNLSSRITSSAGNIGSGGSIGRSLSSGGGLSIPGLASRFNLNTNSGSGNLGVQGSNRLIGGMLQQASPQVMSMFGNSYHSGGSLSQNHVQNSMGMLNDMNNNDGSPFDLNDFKSSFPFKILFSLQLQVRYGNKVLRLAPLFSKTKNSSIQNEDFPALPGFKGGNADHAMELHQKDQLHDNNVSLMQSPHFSMGRSPGFNLGGIFSSPRSQPQQVPSISTSSVSFSSVNNQDLSPLHGSDMFQGSHSSYHSQGAGSLNSPGVGLRPLKSPNTVSSVGSYDQLIQQYQQQQNQSQFRLQQIFSSSQSFKDLGVKSMQVSHTAPDRFGLLGILSVIRMSDPNLTSLALGIDLTTLGLDLNSSENLDRTFGSPWLDEPSKEPPEFTVPQCYYAKQPPVLNQGYLSKFQLNTLFYIFYSMPKVEAQLYAANELYNRGWFYHREHRLWFMGAANMEPLVKTKTYERGSYVCFDPNTWETVRKENFVVYYEMLEKRPTLPQH